MQDLKALPGYNDRLTGLKLGRWLKLNGTVSLVQGDNLGLSVLQESFNRLRAGRLEISEDEVGLLSCRCLLRLLC